jgi:hypothetical protein
MRRLLPLLPVALVSVCVAACGSAGKGGGSPSKLRSGSTVPGNPTATTDAVESLAAPRHGDGDGDSSEQAAVDSDDVHSLQFGHAADAADRQTISAVVKRYYGALASEDGATVCALLLEVVAESLPEEGPNQSRAQSGRAGHITCASAASAELAQSHRALLAEDRTLRVVGVRVRRRRASALLRFGGRSARHILLYREGNAWKIGTLIDEDLG